MSRQRSCSSATTSNLPEDFYNTLLESQRGNLSDAELRQKKMVTPFFIWANYDIMEQTNMQISANYLSAYALNALGCSTSGFDRCALPCSSRFR